MFTSEAGLELKDTEGVVMLFNDCDLGFQMNALMLHGDIKSHDSEPAHHHSCEEIAVTE